MTSKLIVSPAQALIYQDWEAIAKKALYALAPFAIVLIPVFMERVPQDWAYAGIAMYLLGRLKDLFVYYSKQTTYRP